MFPFKDHLKLSCYALSAVVQLM